MIARLSSLFRLDLRSLGLFRIALGLCLVADLSQKLFYAKELYSDWGVMPRSHWTENYMNSWKVSLMLANGEPWFQFLFVGVALAFAIGVTLGFKTRWSQAFCWVLLGSIQSRNNLVLSCADDLMRMALFWSFFVPCGAFFSLDSLRKKESPDETAVTSWRSAALILQLVAMYLFTAFYKIHPVWTEEFSAVYYALNLDLFTTRFGHWMSQFEDLSRLLTASTLIWEIVGSCLLFVPLRTPLLRMFLVISFIAFHFGLLLCLELGTFSWVAMSYWLIFIPGEACEFAIARPRLFVEAQSDPNLVAIRAGVG
jgi:hypothetical protein